MDRAPVLETRLPGAPPLLARARLACITCRLPLKAASFRTWPGSQADTAQDLAVNAACGGPAPGAGPS